ncbi:MAG: hypothetical protein AVDCRST_MAG77-2245 [uncultured Chloroflexi bacterium]|uniref:Uncharacterized protein n=1 Tax=uncultured Chloroflexota bacterium TaxID=166587 RepID=A0A6J4ILT0_9CHLR|nr:MAG: hypothetical protein AVDCRST_MAG77-2245 [uncultured Chloroflexota bacterium]
MAGGLDPEQITRLRVWLRTNTHAQRSITLILHERNNV